MVKLLGMRKKLKSQSPTDDARRVVIKKFKKNRTKILKQSLSKLKSIPDAEQCLRQAVLNRNAFIRAKDLSPKRLERQLITESAEGLAAILLAELGNDFVIVADEQTTESSANSDGDRA